MAKQVEKQDIQILNSILRNNNINSINLYLDNDKLKDNINKEDINIIVKALLLDMEKNEDYDHSKIYHILLLKSLDNDIIKYMLQNKEIVDKNGVYIILNNACNDQQKIDFINNGDKDKKYDFIIERIKDVDFLTTISKSDRLDYLNGVINNPNKTNEIINNLVDTLLELDNNEENFKYINSLLKLTKSNDIGYLNFEKIMNREDINYFFVVEIAKHENITNEMVEKIMNRNDENGTNVMFARTELILNPNVDEKYKIEIIENKEKYPFYNKNVDNIMDIMQKEISRIFDN